MGYVHIPVDFQAPTEADFARFRATIAALAGEPVHIHCIANFRVSAFFYRYRREQGMSDAEARPDLEAIWHPTGAWAAFVQG